MPGTFSLAFFLFREQCENSASSSTSREATASLIATTCSPSSCATNRTASRTQPRLYESALCAKGLPDIPFHASPLMNGKDQYSGLDLRTRKMMLGSFRVFFRHMPVKYHTFAYATKQFASLDRLAGRCEGISWTSCSTTLRSCRRTNGQGLLRQWTALHRGIVSQRDRVCAVEECGRLPFGAPLRVPAVAGGGLHLHHGARSDQVRGPCSYRNGREVLRQLVRFQEGHTEGDVQEARLERRSALGGAFTDNGVCYAGG